VNKVNLKGLDLAELQEFVASVGEQSFRAKQLFSWIYGKGSPSFEAMTNLSKAFRHTLTEHAELSTLRLINSKKSSKDHTEKFLFQLEHGQQIESVLMFDSQRTTLCVSTQVGCAIDCKFCATGMMGLRRHLTAGEIVDQLISVQYLTGARVSNVVFMGMGEPFHNYENVIKACTILTDDLGPGLAKRHIVVSTSGLVPKILQFTDEGHKYRLAISLNATTDRVRSEIMPLNNKWPIKKLLNAVRYYNNKTGQRVTFEYVLLDGINDSVEDAERLEKMVQGILCKINLIPYNACRGKYRRPSEVRMMRFYQSLASLKAPVTIRWSKGEDINAACGQLATISNVEIV
jgi:23S rRNA (adenine2503-C2)-methyltransferase